MSVESKTWSADDTTEPVGLCTMTLWAENTNLPNARVTPQVLTTANVCFVCVDPVEPED